MARARQAPVVSDDEIERRAIRGYYQRLLAGGTPLPEGAPAPEDAAMGGGHVAR